MDSNNIFNRMMLETYKEIEGISTTKEIKLKFEDSLSCYRLVLQSGTVIDFPISFGPFNHLHLSVLNKCGYELKVVPEKDEYKLFSIFKELKLVADLKELYILARDGSLYFRAISQAESQPDRKVG